MRHYYSASDWHPLVCDVMTKRDAGIVCVGIIGILKRVCWLLYACMPSSG